VVGRCGLHDGSPGHVGIISRTVQIDTGTMRYTALNQGDAVSFSNDLEVRGGTFEFTNVLGAVLVGGNFSVFIGTLNINAELDAAGVPTSNTFVVRGSAKLGPDDGVGGPTLNLNVSKAIPDVIVTVALIAASRAGRAISGIRPRMGRSWLRDGCTHSSAISMQ
jgi:hypothetical protein